MKNKFLEKRSMRFTDGHRTSVALEPLFWEALEGAVARESTTIPKLVSKIDFERSRDQSLASAIRCFILAQYIEPRSMRSAA